VIEAMTIGMPIVGLATTEMATAIDDGVSGYVDTDPVRLIEAMRRLVDDPGEAHRLGQNARSRALERFHIRRFVRDWEGTFEQVAGRSLSGPAQAAPGLAYSRGISG
jgi:glycosyltransferase involved in cell wall biosynthesis